MSRPLLQTNKSFSLVKFSWLVRHDHLTNCLNKKVTSFFQPNHPSIALFLSKLTTASWVANFSSLAFCVVDHVQLVMLLVTNPSIRTRREGLNEVVALTVDLLLSGNLVQGLE